MYSTERMNIYWSSWVAGLGFDVFMSCPPITAFLFSLGEVEFNNFSSWFSLLEGWRGKGKYGLGLSPVGTVAETIMGQIFSLQSQIPHSRRKGLRRDKKKK